MNTSQDEYPRVLQELYSLQKHGIKFGLSRTENLLSRIGNPHLGRSFLHIGGSNGKGSVGCLLEESLRASGYRTGLFTSPHLVSFRERFRINGSPIPPGEVVSLYRELEEAMERREPPTFFEAVTAMALSCFAANHTDIAVVEVGMGGRLDATNLITPLVSVITNISLEHREFLGDSLLEVAQEKAGIIKPDAPLVTGATQSQVLEVFSRACREAKTPMYHLDRDFPFSQREKELSFSGPNLELEEVCVGLSGDHQRRNAALALAALDLLKGRGWALEPEGIRRGFSEAVWPGRLHRVQSDPPVILDGAHNPAAAQELASAVRGEWTDTPLILLLGIMEDKDAADMLRPLLPLASRVVFTRPEYPRSMDPQTLCDNSPVPLPPHEVIPSLPEALERGLQAAIDQNGLLLICGSLFTVGEALSWIDPASFPPEM